MVQVWGALLPLLNSGEIAIDFSLHFPLIDLEPEAPVWETRSWHYVRNRIERLRKIPDTSVWEAVANVRGREARREDRARGR